MDWYVYLAYFAAGALIANGVPHFNKGISGQPFQTPFASPPGLGESSALVNVIWGLANFIVGYVLIFAVGEFQIGLTVDALLVALGATFAAVISAWFFGRLHTSKPPGRSSRKRTKKR